MTHMQNTGRMLRLSLLLSLLFGGWLAMGGRAHAASPPTPAYYPYYPVGYDSPQFGRKQYAYGDTISHLSELYATQSDGWRYADLTALTGAPPLSSATPSSSFTRIAGYDSPQFQAQQYAYVDPSHHVQELYYARVNGYWRWNDLTVLTGAPLVLPKEEGSLIGFDSPQFGSKEYAYVADNGHIIELSYRGNDFWTWNDLTALTGAPSPVGVMTLVGFDSPQYGARQYAYLDSNYHLEEIYCWTNNGCAVADLTAITGAPAAGFGTEQAVSGFDSPQLRSKQYAYIDVSGHLQELFYASANGYWSSNDLTALYQAPNPSALYQAPSPTSFGAAFGLAGFDSPQFSSKQYTYFSGQSPHLYEVSYWSGWWHTTDLTALSPSDADGHAVNLIGFASPQFGSRQYGYINKWTGDFEETGFAAGGWWTVDLTQIARP